jgi:dihydrodipicolinate synthase/N-acetylneuraminate lyase
MMKHIPLICRSATIFNRDGGLDENAYRQFLQQFIESGHGIYVGSAGSGEGHALTRDELKRLYAAAVAEAKGKIPVYANPPEQHTARMTLEHALIAAEAGAEVVNFYGPSAWHGFRPTDDEFLAFCDEVFTAFPHRAAIAPNPVIGYTPSPAVVAKVCQKYPQVIAINLAGLSDSYFVALQDALSCDVATYVPYSGSIETLALGAAGLLGAEANIIPKTYRNYLDLYAAGDLVGAAKIYAHLHRVTQFLEPWHRAAPKWIKMFLKTFKMPGGEGGLRAPYRMPNDAELTRFVEGIIKLDIPEINDRAKVAGLM